MGNLTLELKNVAVKGNYQLKRPIIGVDLGKIEVQVNNEPSFLPVIRIQTESSNDYELELIVPDLSAAESLFECMVRIEPTKDKKTVEETRLIFCGNMRLFGVKSEPAERLVEVSYS